MPHPITVSLNELHSALHWVSGADGDNTALVARHEATGFFHLQRRPASLGQRGERGTHR